MGRDYTRVGRRQGEVKALESEKRLAEQGLWEFALAQYPRPGVEALCLELQDEHGLDVPVLLALAWAVVQHRAPAEFDRCLQAALCFAGSHVYPLRALRRRAKPLGNPSFYEALKKAELAAERVQLRILEEAFGTLPVVASTEPVSTRLTCVLEEYARRHGSGAWQAKVVRLAACLAANVPSEILE